MLVSEIKSRFKVYTDTMSFNFSTTQLNKIFAKAQTYYFERLMNEYGRDTQNTTDVSAIFKRITITPASNVILYSSLPDYNRLGELLATYVVGGKTYNSIAKPININNNYSPFSGGNFEYPRYYLQDDGIVLQPSTTPSSVFCTYFRAPYDIDFNNPNDDIPYSEENVQGIIMIAMNNVAQQQREYEQQGSVVNENMFNQKG